MEQGISTFMAGQFSSIGNNEDSLKTLEKLRVYAENLSDDDLTNGQSYRNNLLAVVIEIYGNWGEVEKLERCLSRDTYHSILVLSSAVKAYQKLGKNNESVNVLNKMKELTLKEYGSSEESSTLSFIAEKYIETGKQDEALLIVDRIKHAAQQSQRYRITADYDYNAATIAAKLNRWGMANDLALLESNRLSQKEIFQELLLLSMNSSSTLNDSYVSRQLGE
jgi:lipopolysaccharide biosynthesis regulator YciM